MKRKPPVLLIAATAALPCAEMAGASVPLPTLYESRKLVHVNRVDQVSTNADSIWIQWPTGTLSAPVSIAPAMTLIDAAVPPNDLFPAASEPVAIASSTRVEARRPTVDPRSVGKHRRPS
jgi:hypothetical protein